MSSSDCKLTQLMSIFTSNKVLKFLINIQLTNLIPKGQGDKSITPLPIRAKKNRYIKKGAFSILVPFNLKRSQMRIFFQELFILWQFTSKKFKLFTSYIIICVSVELNRCVLSLQIKIVYRWLIINALLNHIWPIIFCQKWYHLDFGEWMFHYGL